MICLKLATRTGSFQVEVDATPADCGVANINYERKPLAVPGTRNTGTNYADSRYQLPQIDKYFPKGTDLSLHSAADLEFVAMQLNRRPRKTLGFQTPAEKMAALINSTET